MRRVILLLVLCVASTTTRAQANMNLVALARARNVVWYLAIDKDPMAGTEKRHILGAKNNDDSTSGYLEIECYKGKLYMRYYYEYGWPEGGVVEIIKVGDTLLEGMTKDTVLHLHLRPWSR